MLRRHEPYKCNNLEFEILRNVCEANYERRAIFSRYAGYVTLLFQLSQDDILG